MINEAKKKDSKVKILPNQLIYPSSKDLDTLKTNKIIKVEYKTFAGFTIHNLYEFFMVFVVLCGIAAIILALLSPRLKKMMNGLN